MKLLLRLYNICMSLLISEKNEGFISSRGKRHACSRQQNPKKHMDKTVNIWVLWNIIRCDM